jgi:hypothetical protein
MTQEGVEVPARRPFSLFKSTPSDGVFASIQRSSLYFFSPRKTWHRLCLHARLPLLANGRFPCPRLLPPCETEIGHAGVPRDPQLSRHHSSLLILSLMTRTISSTTSSTDRCVESMNTASVAFLRGEWTRCVSL